MNKIKQKIFLKPLSVNEARQGKRYKTKKYKKFEQILLQKLKNKKINKEKKLHIIVDVWFSSVRSDLDNIFKPLFDILQKKYWFDDKRIYQITAKKNIVQKWYEYLDFEIKNI